MLYAIIITVAVLIRPSASGSEPSFPLCCDFDKVQVNGMCQASSGTSRELPRISEINVHLYTDDPCNYEWMASWVPERYEVLDTGSIYAEELGPGKAISDSRHYCLFRNTNSANYSAKVCRPWLGNIYWSSFCLVVADLVLLVVFIGYSVVPELDNLHGLMLRSYIASYMVTYVWALVTVHTAERKSQGDLFPFYVFAMEFWGVSCVFWLNVMSFDIWRTVRCFRSFDYNGQVRRKKKYVWFAVYAWLTPAILISSYATVMFYTPVFQDVIVRQMIRSYARIGVKTGIFLCNTYFYVSTALTIRRHKKETMNLADGINRHHEDDKQWLSLHVKLYLIMGGHMIPWIVWDYWPTPVTTSILVTMEMLQSILICYVFLWKDNVKKALRRKFIRERYPPQCTISTITLDTPLNSS